MRVLIIGAGAIGSFLGARLSLAGHEVALVGRPELVQAAAANGLTLIEPGGTRCARGVSVFEHLGAAMAATKSFDLSLVTVKAYDTAGVVAELRALGDRRLPDAGCLLTLQNGIGNEEMLAEAVGPDRVISGALDTPVSIPAPGQVRVHRPRYKIGLSPVGSAAPVKSAAEALRGAGFDVGLFSDYRGLKWTKLLMNLLANASCAILDWTPARVMAHPLAAVLEARAWQEALAVMAGLEARPVALAGYPFPLLAPIARRLPATWLGRGLRGFVSGGRGDKMPSLHIALAEGKRSEVAWLNGAVVRAGTRLGLPTPVNVALTTILVSLAEGWVAREEYRGRPDLLEAAASAAALAR